MFYAKVSSYARDRDGRVRRFDKSFANPDEYRNFLADNPEYSFDRALPARSFFGWDDLWDMTPPALESSVPPAPTLPEWIDLDRYERAAQEMEAEARKKSQRKAELEAGKERLTSYLQRFREAGKSDLVTSVENDLKKIDEELSSIG